MYYLTLCLTCLGAIGIALVGRGKCLELSLTVPGMYASSAHHLGLSSLSASSTVMQSSSTLSKRLRLDTGPGASALPTTKSTHSFIHTASMRNQNSPTFWFMASLQNRKKRKNCALERHAEYVRLFFSRPPRNIRRVPRCQLAVCSVGGSTRPKQKANMRTTLGMLGSISLGSWCMCYKK